METIQKKEEKTGRRRIPIRFLGRTRPLRRKIVFWNVVILFCTLLLLSIAVYSLVTQNLINDLDQQLQSEGNRVQTLTIAASKSGYPLSSAFFQNLVQEEKGDEFAPDTPKIKLLDLHTRQILSRSANLGPERIPFNAADFASAAHGEHVFRTYQDGNGRKARLLTLPIRDATQHIIFIAQVSLSQSWVERVKELLILTPAVTIFVATLIAYTAGFVLTSYELRPLRTLSKMMRSLSTKGLGTHIEQQSAVIEVHLLTEAFNQMSDHLEASFALQRNFVEDVSHELRTPLTTIQGQMDVLLLHPDLQEDVRQDIEQVRGELGRLTRLVNNLLMIARAEVGMLPRPSTDPTYLVELDTLVITVVRQARLLKRDVSLEIKELQQTSVAGDMDLLKQLLLNIVENALIYTPAGGRVEIALLCTPEAPAALKRNEDEIGAKWAQIRIVDTGPGIDPADLPHIFDRHFRSERTRNMSSRAQLGSGLGLTIAHLIVEAHGGYISIESELGHGACFIVWLPAGE